VKGAGVLWKPMGPPRFSDGPRENLNAKPGLRVKLLGPSWNLPGIGAAIRLDYGAGKLGPVREVHAGSGYLSQDSLLPILGTVTNPQSLTIRWPGGASTTVPIEADVREVIAKSPENH